MTRWLARGSMIFAGPRDTSKIMGIVNVTPDSFSDGGRFLTPEAAEEHASRLVLEGADILDIGGESSRPGSEPVSLDEELRRVIPAVEAIAGMVRVPLSVDTMKPEVARRAVAAGVSILNDITGLSDASMIRVAVETGAGVVVMHMAGRPKTMQAEPSYNDVVAEVYEFLARRVEALEKAGIARERIAIDPGIGFGKTSAHNLELLRNLGRFATLGCALLIGTSRKRFLKTIAGQSVEARLTASVVSSLAAVHQGANVVRVHDVAAMSDALKVWGAIMPVRVDFPDAGQ